VKAKELFPAIFSRHAEAYRRRHDLSGAPSRRRLVEVLAARPGERLLDLACGPGTVALQLAAITGETGLVVGVDLAPGMLAAARKAAVEQGVALPLALMDMERLGFQDSSFDGVSCGHGLQFCPDLGGALREVRRVLGPGGRLVATVPADRRSALSGAIMSRLDSEHLPPAPEAVDRKQTKATVADLDLFAKAVLGAGFASADGETVEEPQTWPDAATMVENLMGWWAIASRLEQLEPAARERYKAAALAALREEFGDGPIEVKGASNLIQAVA
jgi:ubiquinone/menaquinone biosynthesis C-methylase UbiE